MGNSVLHVHSSLWCVSLRGGGRGVGSLGGDFIKAPPQLHTHDEALYYEAHNPLFVTNSSR